ncbi:hypothetical protein [Psychroserpens sp. SPM9]|uniref:hypothetical protein n=1 Tax=Psychroserpens sp. SPM9 TaxID=2975598 RepID=UPI0021A424FA|nr:hypothetical protein [Psychroserpens sp. SPM9]MDG5491525.1 hypothetical protein [Psychroserpens sp. SPM9]
MKQYWYIITLLCMVLFACQEASKDTKRNDVPGDYFELGEDNIKIFLPVYFQKFSEKEYDELIDIIPNSEERRIERARFNYLKFSKGNIYYFRDIASSTLISVKMMDFVPFSKQESAQLLGLLSSSCSAYADLLNMNCEKLNAGYSGTTLTKVFKAAYKMTDANAIDSFNTMYFISSNYKSFAINIFSNTNKNYNSFIEKIVVK